MDYLQKVDRNLFSRLNSLELITLSDKQQALDDDNVMLIHTHLTLIPVLTQLKKKTGYRWSQKYQWLLQLRKSSNYMKELHQNRVQRLFLVALLKRKIENSSGICKSLWRYSAVFRIRRLSWESLWSAGSIPLIKHTEFPAVPRT